MSSYHVNIECVPNRRVGWRSNADLLAINNNLILNKYFLNKLLLHYHRYTVIPNFSSIGHRKEVQNTVATFDYILTRQVIIKAFKNLRSEINLIPLYYRMYFYLVLIFSCNFFGVQKAIVCYRYIRNSE